MNQSMSNFLAQPRVELPPGHAAEAGAPDLRLRAQVRDLKFWYGKFQALHGIDMGVADRKVTAIIGPSGCGKSTLLRCFNRIHDLYPGIRYSGAIDLLPDNVNLVAKSTDAILVRLLIGMVFQKPNPFPKSIFDNVAAGLYVRGMTNKSEIEDRVVRALKQAAVWEETKDRLKKSAYELSGGQQQRLCIARALASEPKMLLLDEPTSALDPIATAKIEELIDDLCKDVTILIVTHNMSQAARISHFTGFMHLGELVEFGPTEHIFTTPSKQQTQDYVTGRYG